MNMNGTIKLICIAVAILMIALSLYGFAVAPGLEPILASMQPYWGKFVWIDVYLGFLLMATVIFTFEPKKSTAVIVLLLMCALGNAVTALWLVWRGPTL